VSCLWSVDWVVSNEYASEEHCDIDCQGLLGGAQISATSVNAVWRRRT